jgi:hypothetical protein
MELIGSGQMFYGNNWAYLSIEDDLVAYYQWFLKRRYHGGLRLHVPKAGAHISTVLGAERDPIDPALKEQFWGLYGPPLVVEFTYNPETIVFNGDYFWLDVQCPFLSRVRRELGLSPTPHFNFHLTLGKLYPEERDIFQTFLRIPEEFRVTN